MSTISEPANIDINEFLDMDSEMDASLVEACLQVDELMQAKTAVAAPSSKSTLVEKVEQKETQMCVKMEFTCEPERLLEPNMDYTLDDVIEIYSIDDDDDEDGEDGIASIINTKSLAEQTNTKNIENDDGENEQLSLSFVMNDHNYSSQTDSSLIQCKAVANNTRESADGDTGNTNLKSSQEAANNSIKTNNAEIDEAERRDMLEFMDNILQYDDKKREFCIKPKKEQNSEASINDNIGNDASSNDPELFLQNVMDGITAEDAADEAAEESHKPSKINETNTNDTSNELNTSHISVEDVDGDETETCSLQSTCDADTDAQTFNKSHEAVLIHDATANESAKETNNVEQSTSKAQVIGEHLKELNLKEVNKCLQSEVLIEASASAASAESKSGEKTDSQDKTADNDSSDDSSIEDKDEVNTTTACGTNTLDENISEPLEMADFEERFEQFDLCMQLSQSESSKLPLLKDLTAFVREMDADCTQFATATNDITIRLKSYILEKFQMMRELAQRCGIAVMKDQEQQTEPKLEKKRLKKLNKKDKRDLLASTDSSSSSSSSSSSLESSSCDELENKSIARLKHKRPKSASNESRVIEAQTENESIVSTIQMFEPKTNNDDSIYDDGINMAKYLRSEIFSAVTTKSLNELMSSSSAPASSSSTDTSDEEKSKKEKSPSEKLAKSEKSKQRKPSQTDENDREIERLINLDGLMKRPINAGSTKTGDMEKSKTKSQKQKTDDILEFLEKDLAKDSLSSDDSVNENEEEVITEKQYLERYNEDLKRQLLDDSSNDTSQDEETDNEFAADLLDESDSGGGNRSPLVDKFLKTYNVEDSEDENTTTPPPIPTAATPINESLTNGNDKKPIELQEENQKIVEQTKDEPSKTENVVATVSDNSDCELLNDNFIYRKRTQPKTLEKILSEAEKRKKIQKLDEDLISLSSESEESDVEAVDVEPAESKSRTIKPMLRPDQLHRETLKAQKNETERIRRLDKRQAMLSRVLKENPELNSDTELVLDYIEEAKTFVKVHPDLVKQLKPHQRDGVRFMYDSVYGVVDASKKNQGSGCILAHCMGLGKTLQLIALMHTVVSYKELKTRKILVLCPKSTVMNWGDEIIRWLYPLATKNLKVFTFNDTSDINEKLDILREWSSSKRAGCLLVGYEAFRTLVFYHKYKMSNNLDAKRLDTIRETISNYLLEPGADLVVCDEGHIIKNSKSAISSAVAEIKTLKRIVLTGTPIQNNLKEYYSMVNFIKPLFLGTEKEFANMYANPIKNGQHKDSSKKDIKVMKQRSFVLHKKLSKFVQRKEAELLKTFLPKKFEYVLFVPMTDVQNKLYERILDDIKSRSDSRGRSLITDYTCLRKIWTHPKVLEDAWKNAVNLSFKRQSVKNNSAHSDDDQPDDIYDSQDGFMSVRNDWWRNLIAKKDLESILPSNKLRTMFEILRMCEESGDKCLIFSAFVAVLNVVEYFFQKVTSGDKEIMTELNFPPGARSIWEPNKDYFRLDGKTAKSTRHEMIKRFNHPQTTRARVFLISAKAGGQGINLIGANRVIILDTSWNPSNDQQNIFRVFRLGQKKNCYIYRLLALGTMEEKVYSRSVTKQAMSFRVVDVQQIDRHYSMAELAELYTLTIPKFSERPTPVLPQDNILANLLRSFPDLVYKYHEHDSLLENKVEQELSEQDKQDAWDAYERDLQMNSQLTQMPNMEDLQNRLAQGQMPSYMPSGMGPMAGLDFQSLLNFRAGMNQASFMNPLLQQNNYSNQQYLEIVSSLRQYASGATGDSAAYNAAAATYASMYGGVMPSVSPHHTSGGSITSGASGPAGMHPLNALSDLSMFGLGSANAVGAANASALYAAAAATSNMPSTAVSAAAGLFSTPAVSYYDQYLQKYPYNMGGGGGGGSGIVGGQPNNNLMNNPAAAAAASALSSFANSAAFQTPRRTPPQTVGRKSSTPDLMGYRTSVSNNSSSLATTATTTSASLAAASLANLMPPAAMSPASNASPSGGGSNKSYPRQATSSAATTSNNQQQQQHQKPIPTSIYAATSNTLSTTTASSSIYSSSKAASKLGSSATTSTAAASAFKSNDAQIRVKDMGLLVANSARSNTLQATMNSLSKEITQTKTKSNDNNISNNSRQRQLPSEQNRQLPSKSSSAAELLKARSEMQIIPTTNPPGTASISKQLSEMSPSISLTAVRNNNNKTVTTTKPANSAQSTAGNSSKSQRSNSNNNIISNSTSIAPAAGPQRQAQQTPQQSQQQAKKPNSNTITNSNVQFSNKMATLTKVTANMVETNKKVSNTKAKSPLTIQSTSTSTPTNNNNNNNITQSNTTTATTTPTPQKTGIASILRQQQFRKMPPTVPPMSVGASTVIYPSAVQNNSNNTNKTPAVATPTNNSKQAMQGKNATVSSAAAKKVPLEKQSLPTKNPSKASANVAKLITNTNSKHQNITGQRASLQSPTTVRITTSGTLRTASPTGTTITRKPAFTNTNSSGLQISAVTASNNNIKSKSTPSLAASITTKIPITATTPVPVQLVRSNSALSSGNRSYSPATATTVASSTLTASKAATTTTIRSNQSATITPKIANVTSLNTSSTATTSLKNIKTVANQLPTNAVPNTTALKRSATSVQLNPQSLKLLQGKRIVSSNAAGTTAASAVAKAVAASIVAKTAAAASTLMQQKQRLSNAGSTLAQSTPTNQQQKNSMQRPINVRPIQKTNTVDSNTIVQTMSNRSGASNLQGIPKFILDRKRKHSDANPKDSGILSKRPKDL